MHRFHGPYGNQVNLSKYANLIKRHKASRSNICSRNERGTQKAVYQFIKLVPEKTQEVIQIEREKWEAASEPLLGIFLINASLAPGFLGMLCDMGVSPWVCGTAYVGGVVTPWFYDLYHENILRKDIKKKIAGIPVPQLSQRKKLNNNIEQANRNFAIYGINNKELERLPC